MARPMSEEQAESIGEQRAWDNSGRGMTRREERELAQARDNAVEREADRRWEE